VTQWVRAGPGDPLRHAWACGRYEQFVVMLMDGPGQGQWLSAPGNASWPLPGLWPWPEDGDPSHRGRYAMIQATEDPQRINGIFRGAMYRWEEDLS
jgi:hypothetical protein